jgi:hydrogenase maturation protease
MLLRILVAGIGHSTLTDLGFGPQILKRLEALGLPDNVELEDLSTSAVNALHKLTEKKYDKLIIVTALQRGEAPGTIYKEQADIKLPSESEIQERMAESVSGAISLDNTLIICKYYRTLPGDVLIIGVEPESTSPGLNLTHTLEEASHKVIELVLKETQLK